MDHRKSLKSKSSKVKRVDSKEISSNVELRTRYDRLLKENSQLDREIEELQKRGVSTNLQPQMKALHEYNEMKDLTQLVLGYLADAEHVTIRELHKRFGLPME
nr:DNA repair protein SWI5 homolog [Leptinotarsa decemlineata]